jgi:hypothetical protein
MPNECDWIEYRGKLSRITNMREGVDLRKTRFEWVYIIQSVAGPSPIKIGRAYRIAKRLTALQAMCPYPLKIHAMFIAPRGTEDVLHALFDDLRVHSEWFQPGARILDAAKALPKAKRITEKELITFCADRGMDSMQLREYLYRGARRKQSRKRRSNAATTRSPGAISPTDAPHCLNA